MCIRAPPQSGEHWDFWEAVARLRVQPDLEKLALCPPEEGKVEPGPFLKEAARKSGLAVPER